MLREHLLFRWGLLREPSVLFRQRLYQREAEAFAHELARAWRECGGSFAPRVMADGRPTASVPSPAVALRVMRANLKALAADGIVWGGGDESAVRLCARPATTSRERELGWAAARMAAAFPIAHVRAGSPPAEVWLSISHTTGVGVSIAASSTPETPVVGVGIDVERHDREVSERVLRRIGHPADAWDDVPPVLRWCIKEACFKADPLGDGSFSRYRVEASPADGEHRLWKVAVRWGKVSVCGLAGLSSGYAHAGVVARPG